MSWQFDNTAHHELEEHDNTTGLHLPAWEILRRHQRRNCNQQLQHLIKQLIKGVIQGKGLSDLVWEHEIKSAIQMVDAVTQTALVEAADQSAAMTMAVGEVKALILSGQVNGAVNSMGMSVYLGTFRLRSYPHRRLRRLHVAADDVDVDQRRFSIVFRS